MVLATVIIPLLNDKQGGSWLYIETEILTLYDENHNVADAIVSKWLLPQINETNIASFVKLRNGKTHSGTVERGDNTKLYAHY